MNVLKMAEAIVRFRVLRSVGSFTQAPSEGLYYFDLDKRGERTDPLINGAPEGAARLTVTQLVDGFDDELTTLCRYHLSSH